MTLSSARSASAATAALGVVLAARRVRALSHSGAAAAWAVGTISVAGGGWVAGGALVAFFATSSILSRLVRRQAGGTAQQRGSERDAVQVAANGGVAALAAVGMAIGDPRGVARAAYYGSLATAAADTWATETGRGSAQPPRRLLVGPVVPAGTSGGMSPRGTIGSIAGAATVAAFAAMHPGEPGSERVRAFTSTLISGVASALADSLLGAIAQQVRVCPVCGRETEAVSHCGTSTRHVRGVRWLDNDGVNAVATATGGLLAATLHRLR